MSKAEQPNDTPLLLRANEAARLCAMSRSHWYRLYDLGRLPEPVRLGEKTVRWRRADLIAWVAAGCPPRTDADGGTSLSPLGGGV